MNIDFIAKIAGVLGFFISVTTFVLTRWERRSRLSFGMDRNHVTTGKIPDNLDEDDESFEAVSLRISALRERQWVDSAFVCMKTY